MYPAGMMQPPPKKGMSGCLIAAIVVFAMGIVGLIIVGVLFVKAWNIFTPAERAQFEAEVRESMVAGSGPAADALRQDGCFGVDIVEISKMPALTKAMVDAGPGSVLTEKIIVDCRPDVRTTSTMTCEKVAKTYLTVVGTAPGPFRVMVHKDVAGRPPACSELRAADGTVMPSPP